MSSYAKPSMLNCLLYTTNRYMLHHKQLCYTVFDKPQTAVNYTKYRYMLHQQELLYAAP